MFLRCLICLNNRAAWCFAGFDSPQRTKPTRSGFLVGRFRFVFYCRGYIIATDTEIFAEFSEFYPALKWAKPRDEKKRVWAVDARKAHGGFAVFSVVCVC